MRYCICPSSARACVELRVERERALECVARVGVAALERRGHAGAEMEAGVLRIGRERFAEALGRRARLSGVERRPRRALDQRGARIDLRAEHGTRSTNSANGSSLTALIGTPSSCHRFIVSSWPDAILTISL